MTKPKIESSDRCPVCRFELKTNSDGARECSRGIECAPAIIEIVLERFQKRVIRSNLRAATPDEITSVENAYLNGNCPHSIVYDTAGWLYDARTCVTCGEGLGLI